MLRPELVTWLVVYLSTKYLLHIGTLDADLGVEAVHPLHGLVLPAPLSKFPKRVWRGRQDSYAVFARYPLDVLYYPLQVIEPCIVFFVPPTPPHSLHNVVRRPNTDNRRAARG